MNDKSIKINAKLQAYSKGIFPVVPSPTQYDIGKILSVGDDGNYTLIEQPITKPQADELIRKMSTIEEGAQVNKIESISVGGKALQIIHKHADIPVATVHDAGVVKSSGEENYVFVQDDGKMEINTINIEKITQRENQDIILECNKS